MYQLRKYVSFILFVCLLFTVGCSQSDDDQSVKANGSKSAQKVSFAVTGIEGMEELQRRYEPFKKQMEELLDIEMEFFSISDRTVSATAMQYDQVDLILGGPSEYAQIKAASPDVELLGAVQRDEYNTVVIVPEESDMKTAKDLKGKTVAMKDVGSTSGHIGPSALLLEQGLDLDRDVNIQMLGDARIEAFKSGEVDALATGIRDYNKMVEEDGKGKYRLLIEGPPLPADPFVASGKLPDDLKKKIKTVLIENQDEILKSMLLVEENDKYKKAKIIEVKDSDFDELRDTYKVLGIEL